MTFPGSSGNNYTGASLGGFEYSDSSYLVAGNYDADNHSRNVFVSSVSKSGGTPVVRYFSDYAGTSDSAATPHLVKPAATASCFSGPVRVMFIILPLTEPASRLALHTKWPEIFPTVHLLL